MLGRVLAGSKGQVSLSSFSFSILKRVLMASYVPKGKEAETPCRVSPVLISAVRISPLLRYSLQEILCVCQGFLKSCQPWPLARTQRALNTVGHTYTEAVKGRDSAEKPHKGQSWEDARLELSALPMKWPGTIWILPAQATVGHGFHGQAVQAPHPRRSGEARIQR